MGSDGESKGALYVILAQVSLFGLFLIFLPLMLDVVFNKLRSRGTSQGEVLLIVIVVMMTLITIFIVYRTRRLSGADREITAGVLRMVMSGIILYLTFFLGLLGAGYLVFFVIDNVSPLVGGITAGVLIAIGGFLAFKVPESLVEWIGT
jgi:hypothetical protein